MSSQNINGTGVALITPFNEDLSVDFHSLGKILEHVLGKVDFLVILGTTGESALLSLDERLSVISFIKERAAGRVPIVLGYGGISTRELIDSLDKYDFSGIDALLTVTPFYVKPSQEGLYRHYSELADASPLPIILYNVPGRTGINMEADTTLALARHSNIIGVKEASGKLFQIEEILMRKSDDFLLFSGDDALTFHLMNAGANGVISVMANAFPSETTSIVHNHAGNLKEATEIHLGLKVLTKAVFADGNPCGIKYVMSKMGLCKNILRLPLVPVSRQTAEIIDSELSL